MSGEEGDFRPRLGRIGDGGERSAMSVVSHVRAARTGDGGRSASGQPARYSGGGRRVMVKARVARMAGNGPALQRAHLSYLSRDGAGKDKARGAFYDREQEGVEGRDFLSAGARIAIISASSSLPKTASSSATSSPSCAG